MRACISRWVWKISCALAVAAGGALLGALPAHGQSITGLGQTDQIFNVCRASIVLDVTACSEQGKGGGGKINP